MLDIDAAGDRFLDLLDVIDRHAGNRLFGDEPLPVVGQVGAQIDDDAVAIGKDGVTVGQPQPIDARNAVNLAGVAHRHDREAARTGTRAREMAREIPRYAHQIAGREVQAAIVDPEEEEDGQDRREARGEERYDIG